LEDWPRNCYDKRLACDKQWRSLLEPTVYPSIAPYAHGIPGSAAKG
jgi:hypothetical protein